ncbi:AbaSI family restriction endonuclease [Clostridium gasigenes]|uniref:SET and RING associated domain-containing protein n=1 Tax=Clostridium gasigenes TaxID=94869 RepID=A0A7X0SDG6_9CLOT|nr:hypothetical protein [Clostridium gasigenes]MBB6715569.1 hypothetical protein [Clostridium gasigenes]
MADKKLTYILKQLAKTNKKNYENYVVTRIYNKLDDLEMKFITQQYISRGHGDYALTDMYFPQINLHVEVDEGQHKNNIEADEIREADIINITNHTIMRVDVTKAIEEIHEQIEEVVEYIKTKKLELEESFTPWDIEKEYSSQTYINKGYIDVKDNVAFLRIVDACNCFGLNYKGWQRGGAKHPIEKDTLLWFPKLYVNDKYTNKLSDDGNMIFESSNNKEVTKEEIIAQTNNPKFANRRIVFARIIGPLGDIMYRFKGEFRFAVEESINNKCIVWEKTSERVKTYKYEKE